MKNIIVLLALMLLAGGVSADILADCYVDGTLTRYFETSYNYNCTTNQTASAVTFGGLPMSNSSDSLLAWTIDAGLDDLTLSYPRYLCGEVNITVEPIATNASLVPIDFVVSNLTAVPCVQNDDSDYTISTLANREILITTNLSITDLRTLANMTLVKGTIAPTTSSNQDILITDSRMGSLRLKVIQVVYNTTDVYAPYVAEETADKTLKVSVRLNESKPNQILPTGLVGDAAFYVFGGAMVIGGAYALLRRRAVRRS